MASGGSEIQYNVPIKVLSTKTTNLICDELNTMMIIPAENGLLRDWRGLSELLHIEISELEKHANPTQKLLQLANEEQKNTIEVLISYLQVLDRFDIIDDYKELIDNDIKQYESIENALETQQQVIYDDNYDAMILYAEADADFAYNLVDVMEKQYRMRFFVRERNLRGGDKEVQKTLTVIAEKCNKVIVVYSPDFLTSPWNEFFLDFAQTMATEQKLEKKIIPCRLTPCVLLPYNLRGIVSLTYSTQRTWGLCFWQRLADAINSVHDRQERNLINPSLPQPAETTEITSGLCQDNNLQLGPRVSNNNRLSNILMPSNVTVASTSKSDSKLCNDTDSVCKKKSSSKKMSAFFSNVTTKLLPKKAKKKSKAQKEKLAVAL